MGMMGHKTPVRVGAERPEVNYPVQFLAESIDWRKIGGVTDVKN
jgi:hypothetical protein